MEYSRIYQEDITERGGIFQDISERDNSEGWNILGYIKKGYQGEEEGIFQDI